MVHPISYTSLFPSKTKAEKTNQPMKKNQLKQQENSDDNRHQHLEILKAVAQAWFSHSNKSRPSYNEHDANRRNVEMTKPTRFKSEAMKKQNLMMVIKKDLALSSNWEFNQSLWDPYEIVTVSKRLEDALVLDFEFSPADMIYGRKRGGWKTSSKESKNSLRNLFNNLSSRRFNDSKIPGIEDTNSHRTLP